MIWGRDDARQHYGLSSLHTTVSFHVSHTEAMGVGGLMSVHVYVKASDLHNWFQCQSFEFLLPAKAAYCPTLAAVPAKPTGQQAQRKVLAKSYNTDKISVVMCITKGSSA